MCKKFHATLYKDMMGVVKRLSTLSIGFVPIILRYSIERAGRKKLSRTVGQ
jgi:hypothetical protein